MATMTSQGDHYQSRLKEIVLGDANSRNIEDAAKSLLGRLTKDLSWERVMEAEYMAGQVQDEKLKSELRREANAARAAIKKAEREQGLAEKQQTRQQKATMREIGDQHGIPRGLQGKPRQPSPNDNKMRL